MVRLMYKDQVANIAKREGFFRLPVLLEQHCQENSSLGKSCDHADCQEEQVLLRQTASCVNVFCKVPQSTLSSSKADTFCSIFCQMQS